MSLKALHLVFVTALSALTFGLCVWKAHDYYFTDHGAHSDLLYAAGAFLAGIVVLVYGWVFLKKLKKISYL